MIKIYYLLIAVCLIASVQLSYGGDISYSDTRTWPSDQWKVFYTADTRGGFKDQNGNVVVPAKYDEVLDFSQGRGFVLLGDKWHLINESGEFVGSNTFYDVRLFHEGIAAVYVKSEDGILCAYIDRDGQYIVKPMYKGIVDDYYGGYGRIKNPSGAMFFNHDGDLVVKYLDSGVLREGLRAVKMQDSNLWGFVDEHFQLVIEPKYYDAKGFSDGYAPVLVDNDERKWAYIDKDANIVIKPQFEEADIFSEDLAAVVMQGKVGYVNKRGIIDISCKYNHGSKFVNDRALVDLGTAWVWIDKNGNHITKQGVLSQVLQGYSAMYGEYFVSIIPPNNN